MIMTIFVNWSVTTYYFIAAAVNPPYMPDRIIKDTADSPPLPFLGLFWAPRRELWRFDTCTGSDGGVRSKNEGGVRGSIQGTLPELFPLSRKPSEDPPNCKPCDLNN